MAEGVAKTHDVSQTLTEGLGQAWIVGETADAVIPGARGGCVSDGVGVELGQQRRGGEGLVGGEAPRSGGAESGVGEDQGAEALVVLKEPRRTKGQPSA